MSLWITDKNIQPERFEDCYITYLDEGITKVARASINSNCVQRIISGPDDGSRRCWKERYNTFQLELGDEVAWMREELPEPYDENKPKD